MCIFRTCQILQKIHQGLCKDGQADINLINPSQGQVWMDTSHTIQPSWCWRKLLYKHLSYATQIPARRYIVYMDALDDACGAQLSQENNGAKFPIAFLSHTFTETQRKWSTLEQEAYGVYYAITKWNYYLQGANIIVCNDHKPLAKFLNGKNANNKVNRWGLELVTYNIMFEWISGAWNKAAAHCLSRLVKLPNYSKATIKMLTATISDGPAFNTRSKSSHQCQTTMNT